MVSPALFDAALVSAWSKCPDCYTAHADRPAQQKIMRGDARSRHESEPAAVVADRIRTAASMLRLTDWWSPRIAAADVPVLAAIS
jgi:hypothetical protein